MTALRMRLARKDDAPAIARLARRVVRRWIVPEQPPVAVIALEESLRVSVIREKIAAGQRFHLAFVDGALAGVSAVRNDSHVFQLFVGTRYQGQGIARQLWERLRRDCVRRAGTRVFTLNAAPGAVPVYLNMGFEIDHDPTRPRGKVIAVPMIYRVDDHA
jgi:GNAT superfamily N-acetyltransferase